MALKPTTVTCKACEMGGGVEQLAVTDDKSLIYADGCAWAYCPEGHSTILDPKEYNL